MATSKFRVDYHDGQPDLVYDEMVFFDEAINDYAGGWSAMEDVADPNQAQVLMLVEASVEKLTEMKGQPERYEWIEDVSGWPA